MRNQSRTFKYVHISPRKGGRRENNNFAVWDNKIIWWLLDFDNKWFWFFPFTQSHFLPLSLSLSIPLSIYRCLNLPLFQLWFQIYNIGLSRKNLSLCLISGPFIQFIQKSKQKPQFWVFIHIFFIMYALRQYAYTQARARNTMSW